MTRHLPPITGWLPRYRAAWLVPDALAGLTVWALVVPESMAYASIAGVPVQYGLYSVPLAIVGYAIFGSSRRLFVGPSSTVAVLAAATVAPYAATNADRYIVLMAVLSLLVGVLYIVLGLARMGFIARFFAKPVLDGFIVGLGIYIAVGQLPKLVGAPKSSGNTLSGLWGVVTGVGDWDRTTTLVGLGSLAILLGLAKVLPRIPGALVVVVLGIAAATLFDLGSSDVDLVGSVPTGFDFVSWSGVGLHDVVDMVPGALGIVVVGFAQSLAIAKAYAAQDNVRIDANGEMIGYGAAGIGAGLLQGFTPTGSLSKSAAATEAGSKSPVSFLVVAALVVLTVLFIAGVFEQLPEAVLGAIVIHAVSGMIAVRKVTRLWKASVPDFWLAVGALAGVVTVGILAGIVVGVVLSLVLLLHRLAHPHAAILGRLDAEDRFADVATHADARSVPGVLVYRLEAPFIFANAEVVADDLRTRLAAADPSVHTVVFDFEAVYEIDTEGADTLVHLAAELAAGGAELVLARAHAPVLEYLRRVGSLDELGEEVVFGQVADAVLARS